ncbi:hypothetical protein FN846DRAFT_124673 [Sphaerosporella brunnea]|uniref:Uncharacterized protein n=1 Tax=Sphaerosporella brunnea TaxID=1250544 RepID=A0A5J5ERN9_9PEZI|nr:hypothetical protein FN846DRAFT_124673 [Sphaerosporella brunnea]
MHHLWLIPSGNFCSLSRILFITTRRARVSLLIFAALLFQLNHFAISQRYRRKPFFQVSALVEFQTPITWHHSSTRYTAFALNREPNRGFDTGGILRCYGHQ